MEPFITSKLTRHGARLDPILSCQIPSGVWHGSHPVPKKPMIFKGANFRNHAELVCSPNAAGAYKIRLQKPLKANYFFPLHTWKPLTSLLILAK